MAAPVVELSSLLVSKPGYRQGRPCLRGTGITVHNVAAAYIVGGSIEQICEDNSGLDRSLFLAALAYYFANRERIDAEIDQDRVYAEGLAARFPNGITREPI